MNWLMQPMTFPLIVPAAWFAGYAVLVGLLWKATKP